MRKMRGRLLKLVKYCQSYSIFKTQKITFSEESLPNQTPASNVLPKALKNIKNGGWNLVFCVARVYLQKSGDKPWFWPWRLFKLVKLNQIGFKVLLVRLANWVQNLNPVAFTVFATGCHVWDIFVDFWMVFSKYGYLELW